MMTICGVVVPVAFWPEWVQTVAFALPVTHGLYSIRLLMADEFTDQVLVGVVLEAGVGLLWLGLGILTLDRTVKAARRTGAIDLI
jgi:ABC-2 type transport system permease protein